MSKDSKVEEVSAFYCELCKCALKDSTAWYDHINGKKHNRLKGMSMIVERVEVDRVKAKLESLKSRKKEQIPDSSVLGKRPRIPNSDEEESQSQDENSLVVETFKKQKVELKTLNPDINY